MKMVTKDRGFIIVMEAELEHELKCNEKKTTLF